MFSNYAASNFWGLQPDLVVKIAKTRFDFHSNSFQVILFTATFLGFCPKSASQIKASKNFRTQKNDYYVT